MSQASAGPTTQPQKRMSAMALDAPQGYQRVAEIQFKAHRGEVGNRKDHHHRVEELLQPFIHRRILPGQVLFPDSEGRIPGEMPPSHGGLSDSGAAARLIPRSW